MEMTELLIRCSVGELANMSPFKKLKNRYADEFPKMEVELPQSRKLCPIAIQIIFNLRTVLYMH